MTASSTVRERRNWWIHLLYVRQEYDECLRVIEEVLRACNGLAEYPLYVKGERSIVSDDALALGPYKLVNHVQLVHVNLIHRPHPKTARTHRGVPDFVSGCDLPQSVEHCESQTSCPLAVSA
jgi:hypothetical protein